IPVTTQLTTAQRPSRHDVKCCLLHFGDKDYKTVPYDECIFDDEDDTVSYKHRHDLKLITTALTQRQQPHRIVSPSRVITTATHHPLTQNLLQSFSQNLTPIALTTPFFSSSQPLQQRVSKHSQINSRKRSAVVTSTPATPSSSSLTSTATATDHISRKKVRVYDD
ncbi:unnamed protein product, partial [Didymodactylos carnosus]